MILKSDSPEKRVCLTQRRTCLERDFVVGAGSFPGHRASGPGSRLRTKTALRGQCTSSAALFS